MATTKALFPTLLFQQSLAPALKNRVLRDIGALSQQDSAGQEWSKAHYRNGYTSYASLADLHRRTPAFAALEDAILPLAGRFARELGWQLRGRHLEMTACWMNVMPQHTYHTLHLHPHSALSGTYYVQVPPGSSCLKLEDPRMPMYMHAPVRETGKFSSLYYEIQPKPGTVVLFESWLRHEVPPNASKKPRISVSFNLSLELND